MITVQTVRLDDYDDASALEISNRLTESYDLKGDLMELPLNEVCCAFSISKNAQNHEPVTPGLVKMFLYTFFWSYYLGRSVFSI